MLLSTSFVRFYKSYCVSQQQKRVSTVRSHSIPSTSARICAHFLPNLFQLILFQLYLLLLGIQGIPRLCNFEPSPGPRSEEFDARRDCCDSSHQELPGNLCQGLEQRWAKDRKSRGLPLTVTDHKILQTILPVVKFSALRDGQLKPVLPGKQAHSVWSGTWCPQSNWPRSEVTQSSNVHSGMLQCERLYTLQ